MFSADLWRLVATGFGETLYMTLISTFFSYLLGLPLGLVLVATERGGVKPLPWLNSILGGLVNILRSAPFIILMVAIMPFTRLVVGTTIGIKAVSVALVVAATPFVARLVESSAKEVDHGVIEASLAMGASPWQVMTKVILPEAKPSLLVGAAIATTTILGYSAMAGIVGGGGLGGIAINYGYYRSQSDIMLVMLVFLILIVQVFQEVGTRLARRIDKRIR